jgi:two-component system CheB/CheR fusion protein
VEPPTHHGFGSQLVHHQLRYEFNGTAEMDFDEEGVRVTLSVPTDASILEEPSGTAASS